MNLNNNRKRSRSISNDYIYEYNNKKDEISDSEDDKDEHRKKHQKKKHQNGSSEGLDGVYCKDNRIYFRASVTGDSVDKLIKLINEKNDSFKELEKNKLIELCQPKPLYLFITSFGGSLFACFRAIDCIKNSRIPIYTVVDGHAASAGTLMSVVGQKRYMTEHSYMLIHQLSSGTCGKFGEIKDDYENCETIMEDIYRIYEQNTNMSREELEEYLSHDLWWKVDKCMKTGLIDEVYKNNH